MEELLAQWSGETVVIHHDLTTGAWMLIAIHSTRLGPAAGGTRMMEYPELEAALRDALRLAEGMTYKFATPGMPFGGGKAVIALPPGFDPDHRAQLLRRYGKLVSQLGGAFRTGPDVGTTPTDMDIIAEEGDPYILSRSSATGGIGDPGPYTARGVFTGIEVVCEQLFGTNSLTGRRVLVQGAGDVGRNLIQYLRDAGAEVLFSEVDESAIRHARDEIGAEFVPPADVYTTECDVFSPCALGGVLGAETIPLLRCRAVAGSANNQLDQEEDAERLRSRGILYAPDYVVNVGGALAIIGLEYQGWTPEVAEQEVVSMVRRALREIFESSLAEGITTETVARRIARRNLDGSP
jgi:leucine dehydrogenase